MAKSMGEIAELLQNVRFKRRLIGGVDEEDVWRKLERLQAEYAALIEEERLKNRGVVEEWQRIAAGYKRQADETDKWMTAYRAEAQQRQTGPPGNRGAKGGGADG